GWAGNAGDAGDAGDAGAGGTADTPPSLDVLIGDYDVYFAPLPPLSGCSPAVAEPRMNLALFFASSRKLDLDADGVRGTGFAEVPYTCQNGLVKTQRMPVTVKADRTPPKLRVDPVGFTLLGFTRFSFRFSEPVALPSGSYDSVFSEPSDGEQTLQLYDVDTNAVPPAIWQWSLGGPVSEAHFVDPASVEARTFAARLIAPLADRAGN